MAQSLVFLPSPQEATRWCVTQRNQNKTIGYVPTMGALHAGHGALIERALAENDFACVSIFVNPLQFNDATDLKNYPTNLEKDLQFLERLGCHMAYSGSLSQFFPEIDTQTQDIPLTQLDNNLLGLEDDYRPGHLAGVATIVNRLFTVIGECKSYFGEKDFQQSLIVQRIAKQLTGENTPVEVIVCPTVRDSSGLALSSRNGQLSTEQKQTASTIYQALQAGKAAWNSGITDPRTIETSMATVLQHADIQIEYVAVRDATHWTITSPQHVMKRPQGLIAVSIAGVRLIDNLCLSQ